MIFIILVYPFQSKENIFFFLTKNIYEIIRIKINYSKFLEKIKSSKENIFEICYNRSSGI